MAKMKIKRIEILSLAKICAGIYGIAGFVVGLLMASGIGGMMMLAPMGNIGIYSGMLAFAAIIVAPIVGAVYGFVIGTIVAFLYNLLAERIGGVEFETGK